MTKVGVGVYVFNKAVWYGCHNRVNKINTMQDTLWQLIKIDDTNLHSSKISNKTTLTF